MSVLTTNRWAKYNYKILETFAAGLVLKGLEVKSIKTGHLCLKGAYITLKNNNKRNPEAYLKNAHIPPYQPLNTPSGYDPLRERKLLLQKKELTALIGKIKQKGLTLIPIKVYTKKGRIKVEIALARGKKEFDKREIIKKRAIEKQLRIDYKL